MISEAVNKLNAVLKLLLSGKLKKDIDDSILEKLLTLLHSSFKEYGIFLDDPIDILKKTEFLRLFENTFDCLMTENFDVEKANILSFAIRAFGIFMSQKDVFNFVVQNGIILDKFSKLCVKDFAAYKASVHSALLISLRNILDHPEGTLWFLNVEGIVDNIFKSFSALSYYVRRDAKALFTRLLICISSEDFKNNDEVRHLLHDLICNKITPSVVSSGDSPVKSSCILLLLDSMKNCAILHSLLCNQYNLLEKVVQCFEKPGEKLIIDENMIILLIDCFMYTKVKKPDVIFNILNKLMEYQLIGLSQNLMTSLLLKKSEGNLPIGDTNLRDCISEINFILHPLFICTNITTPNRVTEEHGSTFAVAMKSKEWVSIINASLNCTKKIVPVLNSDDLCDAIRIISSLSCECFSEKILLNFEDTFRNKQIVRSLMDLISTVIDHKDFATLDNKYHIQLFEGLIHKLGIEYDVNILSSILTVTNKQVKVIDLDAVYDEKFCAVLYKKMLSSHWSIADIALEILHSILCRCVDCNSVWLKKLCSKDIFTTVWSIAIISQADDYVRATAVKILALFYSNDVLWQQLSTLEVINLENFMAAIISLAINEDVFAQRAAITALTHWLNIPKFVESDYYQLIPTILLKVIQMSSDSECKIIALSTWKNINGKFLSNASNINDKNKTAEKILRFYSENFYILALQLALEDFHLTVNIAAVKSFLELREELSQLDITRDCIVFSGDSMMSPCENCEIRSKDSIQDQNCFSEEEKNSGIDYVINKTTLELIQNISVPVNSNTAVRSIIQPLGDLVKVCCQKRFWEKLWSSELESKLRTYSQSSDIYEQNPIRLLDDILAAKIIDHNYDYFGDGYEAMDCY